MAANQIQGLGMRETGNNALTGHRTEYKGELMSRNKTRLGEKHEQQVRVGEAGAKTGRRRETEKDRSENKKNQNKTPTQTQT